MVLVLLVLRLMLTINGQVQSACVYEKYFQKTLNEKHATIYASMGIQSVLECKQICLEHGVICVGANVYASGRHHVCSLFSEINTPITEDALLASRNGKLIVKVKGICPDFFKWKFRKSCYAFNKEELRKTEAEAYCKKFGSQLVSIETMDEFSYIKHKLESEGAKSTWTSAKKDVNTDVFTWAGGKTVVAKEMWVKDQPDSSGECGYLWSNHGFDMDDDKCGTLKSVLCEIVP